MKGLTKRDIPVLALCLSAVLLVVVYSFIWRDGQEKLQALKESNEKLTADVEGLREKAANKEFYDSETERMQQEIDAIYSYFPADVLMEDGLYSAIELEQTAPMISYGIGYTPAVTVYTVGQGGEATDTTAAIEEAEKNAGMNVAETELEEDVATARSGNATYYSDGGDVHLATAQLPSGYEGEYGPISLRDSIFTYNFETSYSGFKNIVDYFAHLPGRATIAEISLGFDPGSGLLNGNATVNRYSMTGTGTVYEQPAFPSVATGRSDIFGAMQLQGQTPGKPESEEETTEE